MTPELEVLPELPVLPELDVLPLDVPPPDPEDDVSLDASGKSPIATNPPLHPGAVERATPTAAIEAVERKAVVRMTRSSSDER